MIATAMEQGSHFFEWEHQRINGETFAADVLLTRMEVEGEEPFLQATVRDISEHKEAEKQIRQITKIYATLSLPSALKRQEKALRVRLFERTILFGVRIL
jgi:hypothetical protein